MSGLMIFLWVLVGIIILALVIIVIVLAVLYANKTCPPPDCPVCPVPPDPSWPTIPTYGTCTTTDTFLVSSLSREFQYWFRVTNPNNAPITLEQYNNNATLPIWEVASELQKAGIPYRIALGLETYNGVWYYRYPNQVLQPLFVLYNYDSTCKYSCPAAGGECMFDCHNTGQTCANPGSWVGDNASQAASVKAALIKYGIMSS